jgi:hypothetical protein
MHKNYIEMTGQPDQQLLTATPMGILVKSFFTETK